MTLWSLHVPCRIALRHELTFCKRNLGLHKHIGRKHAVLPNYPVAGHTYPAQSRQATILASHTAINRPIDIPKSHVKLYESLKRTQDVARDYIDSSRLQLALRSLEDKDAPIRIGVIGVGTHGFRVAARLAQILTADALSPPQAWEDQILDASPGTPILLRYGERDTIAGTGPVHTLSIPSLFLQQNRIELLLTTLSTKSDSSGPESELVESILTPTVGTPISSSGRSSQIRYPVHKALVLADGIEGCLGLGRLLPAIRDHADLMITAVNTSGAKLGSTGLQVVDIDAAARALATFRRDVATGSSFNEQWQSSGISELTKRLLPFSKQLQNDQPTGLSLLDAQVQALLSSGLHTIESSIKSSESALLAHSVPDARRAELQDNVKLWAQQSHTELQTSLACAEQSSSWRRISWYKLLWGVDDVSNAVEDVFRSHWLVDTEARLAYLSGTIRGAGFITDFNLSDVGSRTEKQDVTLTQDTISAKHTPWPMTIVNARQSQMQTLVPAMQARAQSLVLQTYSMATASSALGVWYYAATYGTGLYEAGALAAFGVVWSLARLQKRWTAERRRYLANARESGRLALQTVTMILERLVREAQRPALDVEDVQRWDAARRAIQDSQKALQDVTSKTS